MPLITCLRCKKETQGFSETPLPGPHGDELLQHTCPPCFDDWMRMETMIINEYRLDLGLPRNQELLNMEMAKFLALPSAPEGPPPEAPPEATPR